MLGGLALKRRWRHARRAAGKSTEKPNLVMSSAAQACWEKFCNYGDVEARYIPVTDEHPVFDGHDLADCVENTIGVVAVIGVLTRGRASPWLPSPRLLDAIEQTTGLDIAIHVDGAPFLPPELEWDFRLERVLGTQVRRRLPGVGWIWREEKWLPEDFVLRASYLGGDMPTFALNSSRPGCCCSSPCSSGSVSRGTPPCSGVCRRSRCTCRAASGRWVRSSSSATAATCRCSRGACARATPRTGTCTTSPTGCAHTTGSCPHTRCPTTCPTAPCSAWWSGPG